MARTNIIKDNITLMVAINAAGVTKGKTKRPIHSYATLDAPSGTVCTFQENAWMNNAIGVEWFKNVFLPHCGPQRPQLMTLDSQGSHDVIELLELAREEKINVLALPPNATHMQQPLERVVFAPFKKTYRRHCTEFMREHPGHAINKTSWPMLLNRTWQDVIKMELLKKSFQSTGISYQQACRFRNSFCASRDA